MGPKAGITLFDGILQNTPAFIDQHHIPVVMISYPNQITDRTEFLEGKTVINPAFSIAKVIQQLEVAGAKVVGIACNTSYAPPIFDVIQAELRALHSCVMLVNMPLEVIEEIRERFPDAKRVGVMSTNGTYLSGLYSDLLEAAGYEVILPDRKFQGNVIHRIVYDPIFGIKANSIGVRPEAAALINRAIDFFKAQSADVIILGCTELSVSQVTDDVWKNKVVDSTQVLSRALIKYATS